jgi:vacuolar protein sorting-associated protein 33A
MTLQKLAKLLTRPLPRTPDTPTPTGPPETSDKIDSLIILDRGVDMITPLLTQLTYEGLVDELIGIKNCEYYNKIYSLAVHVHHQQHM